MSVKACVRGMHMIKQNGQGAHQTWSLAHISKSLAGFVFQSKARTVKEWDKRCLTNTIFVVIGLSAFVIFRGLFSNDYSMLTYAISLAGFQVVIWFFGRLHLEGEIRRRERLSNVRDDKKV